MKIAIIVPVSPIERTGNYRTAIQWKEILEALDHEVVISKTWPTDENLDTEVALFLHGKKTHDSILRFDLEHPEKKKILALTGTDIYPKPGKKVLKSIRLANRVVVLQEKAVAQVPTADQPKVHVIYQSATPAREKKPADSEFFDVSVIGHLRDVKDPLRATKAAQSLPDSSRIRILQAGGIIDWKYLDKVETEDRDNPRYQWLGELDGDEVSALLSSSQLMVISSFSEGGARVVGEAVVNGTPLIATRIDGITGLLGDAYPGYFDPGDTQELASLMHRAETDPDFLAELKNYLEGIAHRFQPEKEKAAWADLLDEISRT